MLASVIRFMTYNILNGGVDDDGDSRLPLIHGIVASVGPDVLAIQEANEFDRRAYRRLFAFERALNRPCQWIAARSGSVRTMRASSAASSAQRRGASSRDVFKASLQNRSPWPASAVARRP